MRINWTKQNSVGHPRPHLMDGLQADHERSKGKNYEQIIFAKSKQSDDDNVLWNNLIST